MFQPLFLRLVLVLLAGLLSLAATGSAHAQATQTWIPGNANNDWSVTAPNWDTGVPWTNGNSAIFGGAAETVEIASDITVSGIAFTTNGYVIADANNDSIFSLSSGSIITVPTAGQLATISENIAAGGLTKGGSGILLLTGDNTFGGTVSVTAGTLRLGSNTALGSASASTNVSGSGIVELQNGVTISGETILVGSGGDNNGGLRAAASATATWAGSILLDSSNRIGALNGALFDITGVIGNGAASTLQIATTGSSTATLGIVRISAPATYTGNTSIIRGRLQLGVDGALPSGTTVDIDTATAAEDSIFDLNGHIQTVAGLARSNAGGTGGGSFVTNTSATAATLTLGGSTSLVYSGIIQDGAGLVNIVKNGAGTQTLSGNNTYGGTTTVTSGTLVFSGNNTLPGAISVSGGALNMSGNNTLGAITVTGGSANLSGSNTINGNIATSATLTLGGANTIASSTTLQVSSGGVLNLGNNGALGSITAFAVASGGRTVLQNGVTITGKTITLAGGGGNNNGALQTDPGAGVSATWAGNIITASGDTRIGGGDSATLNVNGVISGTGGILYSRANSSTTVLNGVSTYTGDTQLFANGGTGAKLVLGVDNALSGTSKLSVFTSVTATVAMTVDFNGRTSAFTALDTSANHASGNVLFLLNNAASTASVLTLSGTGYSSASEFVFNGRINDGASGTGGMSLVKNGSYVQTLVAANGYTGSTTVNAGTLQLGKGGGTTFTGSNGTLASTSIILNGVSGQTPPGVTNTGTLAIDNLGTGNNNGSRLADTAALSMRGGTFTYRGSDQAGTNSAETLGSLTAYSKRSNFYISYGGANTATLTFGSYSREANGGIIVLSGLNLGLDGTSTASVSRVLFTAAPDLVGTTAASSTGAGTVTNLQIVPGLLSDASGGTGNPNTFLTYNPATGLRPLSLTGEYSASFTAGDNVRLTAAATLGSSMSINSLIITGDSVPTTYTATIGAGKTLTVASGQILFGTGSNYTLGGGGTLAFGSREGIITTFGNGNTFITAVITGTAGVSYYGSGTMVTNMQHTYSGPTALYQGVFIPQVGSQGAPNAPASGPFGTGLLILGGTSLRASTSSDIVIHNTVDFRNDTSMISGSINRAFTFAGDVSLTNGTRTLTNGADANTYFTGVISETTPGSGLTIAGTGTKAVVLSGSNTYTGATTVSSATTLVINGSQTAATGAVNVNAGTLGGMGALGGSVTVASGATLSPGDVTTANLSLNGTLASAGSLTLKSGSSTALQITTATFTSTDNFGGNAPGTAGYNNYVITNGNLPGSAGTAHDKLIFSGAITQENGAKITVAAVGAFTPASGQIFNLLDWSDVLGTSLSSNLGATTRDGSADSAFDLDLPDISGSGYVWDTSLFAAYGIIVITPEPGRALLLALGIASLALRRRRNY